MEIVVCHIISVNCIINAIDGMSLIVVIMHHVTSRRIYSIGLPMMKKKRLSRWSDYIPVQKAYKIF